jgi:hypothetical protein
MRWVLKPSIRRGPWGFSGGMAADCALIPQYAPGGCLARAAARRTPLFPMELLSTFAVP